jgi:ABC-type branched-subunit amino acid transport system substrate-binding protein
VVITINHWYRLGSEAFVLGLVLLAVSGGSWLWFRASRRPMALAGYGLMNAWIVIGFGLYKGLWKTAVPLATGRLAASFGLELSGLLTFAASLFVFHTAARFIAPSFHRAKSTIAVLALTMGAWLAPTPLVEAQTAGRGPIKIGVVATTSGPAGLLGESFLKSIQLAKEETFDTTREYRLVIEQIPSPDQAEPAIKKLTESDKVDAVIVAMSMSGEIVKPHAAAAKIPFFCICSVGSLGDELYTFTTMPLAEDEASMWVTEAQRRGVRRIARFTQDFPSIDNHVRAIKADAADAGMTFVYENRFSPTTTDFRAAIEAAKAVAPDLYYVEGFNPTLDILGKQLRGAGVDTMASVVAFSISDTPNVFEGGWYTDSYVSHAFKARLEQRYPGERLATHMMPYAYDSYKILVDAFESGQDALTYIRSMTAFNGTAGLITKQAGTGNFRSAPAVWTIKAGKPTLLTGE